MGEVVEAIEKVGGEALITADHGNSEKMADENGDVFTAHTTNPVPLIYVGDRDITFREEGALCDLAPTLLELMNMERPVEMTGYSLIERR